MTLTISSLARRAEKLVSDNSPLILTAIGVTGTVTTAVLASRAGFKAATIIEEAYVERSMMFAAGDDLEPFTPKQKLDMVWKLYIPVVGTSVLTVACIIAANRIGTRRAAAMAAAYTLSEKAFMEYKDKVIETLGENKERKIQEAVIQDKVDANPVSSREVILTGDGDVLCWDAITGRYFHSNIEALRKAQNDINQQILSSMYATLHEFYNLVGLPSTLYSSEVGWNPDCMLDLEFSTVLSESGKPCLAVGYKAYPIRGYY